MTKKKYIPINKGLFFDLEPPERVQAFTEKLSKDGRKNIKNIVFYGMIYPKKELLEIINY